MEVSTFHSFLSYLVTQDKNFSFKQTTADMGGRKMKELKKKKKREREEEGKRHVANGDRESHLCEAKCFHNCVGDLVVWYINEVFDFSIFLLLRTSKP